MEEILLLQIASGKLFTQTPGQKNNLRGIIHTNLCFLRKEPIETIAGRLIPTDTISQLSGQLVYEFTEFIEQPPAIGVVASHGIEPYLYDFTMIVSLVLNVTCTVAPETVSRLTSGKRGPKVNFPPHEFIPRVFESQVLCREEDIEQLIEIVSYLIGLKRKSFLAAMRAIRTYVVGLHRIADDLELAYVLLVASIESLSQDFDDFLPVWDDYDEAKKRKIDDALVNADKDTAEKVRAALLEVERQSLAKRFREFAIGHLHPAYFREDTSGIVNPASRTDLEGALREAYRLRSRYVHSLQELPQQLAMATLPGETISIEGRTFLTLRGIARLARHVIIEFIRRQEKVETEAYNYSRERAGIVHMPMAPRYWIGNAENVTSDTGRKRLEGFLCQITACMAHEKDAAITDLHEMLQKVETMLPAMNEDLRRPFLSIYFVYNGILPDDKKMVGLKHVNQKYGPEIEKPSIEGMFTHLILCLPTGWSVVDHRCVHEAYFFQRERKTGLKAPQKLEAGISLALAERYRAEGDAENAWECIKRAVEDCPGYEMLRSFEEEFNRDEPIDWLKVMFPPAIGASTGVSET